MKMKSVTVICLSIILIIISCFTGNINGVAVMSVDLGSEWFKVAIVSPGIPMEIALNKESKRKTPTISAFRDDERLFGEDAQIVGVRFPKNSFQYILDLVGKSIDNPIVELYRKRFPHYDIIPDEERNTIIFKLNEDMSFTPEELLAQILHTAKEMAENSANQKINEVVLTVPGFFNQAERRAILKAAELADLKVLQLINDYTAVALNYGIFHKKKINDTAHYILFYDMGASSTTAAVVSYQNVKTKDRGIVETSPQVSILGVGYDRTLGGLEVQIKLQHYLASEFDKMKKTPNSVFKNPRAMAKLFKEAGRVKNVLSANADHYAQIESLLDDKDFRLHVTREKLEELCADVFERVTNPIKMALDVSGLSIKVISQVVIVGAATRMPKIQDILTAYVGSDLSKSINADEAAAMGAVYKAAELSQGFKVTRFITKDAVLFPIQIVFDKSTDDKPRQVRRTLFGKMNSYPQKKIITFNKRKEDFSFDVNYAELDYLPPHEIKAVGNLNLSTIFLSGVAEALEKHIKEGAESKGIKAHFVMDESGVLNLLNVELVGEKTTSADAKDEGTFSKLGSTITQFFSGSEDTEKVEKAEEPPKEDVKPVHEEPEQPPEPAAEEKPKTENETKTEEKSNNQTTDNKTDKKMTVTVLKEPIKSVEVKYGPQELKDEKLKASREKIKALELRDLEKKRRETALNNLESFVINTQQDLKKDEYIKAGAPTEIEKIADACQKTSDWLYEDGFDAAAETYEEKLQDLQSKTHDLYERVFEHRERPEALAGMFSILNASNAFLNNMKTYNNNQIFTQIEIEKLAKTINDTVEYHETVIRVTAETPLHEPVKYSVRDIANKMAILDREVKYLMNKAKIWKPKQETASNQTEKTDEAAKDNQTESTADSTTGADEEQIVLEAADDKISESALPETSTVNENEQDDSATSSTSDDQHQEL
ncbi:hypoxia up-regulated protein 1 [Chelonus insularis]|uniref:hypoxia up-regulated protein 1 n=1 Tax=Chelonus insularis TaxID=460826 RepID=UPI00158D15AC|nr:hypoxia up-regulated protein 1 [Chelonus insularis]XP_034943170.1 hypoxia up-regulated protein 1 [Chelonus insularis]